MPAPTIGPAAVGCLDFSPRSADGKPATPFGAQPSDSVGMNIRVEALPLRDPTGHGVWQPMKDPKTGRVYWTNHALQKTVWKPPQACTHVPAPASPWLDELLGLGLAGALVDLAVDTNMVQMTNASREKKRKKARYVRTPYTFPPTIYHGYGVRSKHVHFPT